MSRKLFALDQIDVASPCSVPWEEMEGDDTVRFCGHCRLHVYNLSGMTRDEAEALVRRTEGTLCVRFYRRGDGTVLTRDCPVGWRAVRLRLLRKLTAVTSLLATFLFGSATRTWAAPWSKCIRWLEGEPVRGEQTTAASEHELLILPELPKQLLKLSDILIQPTQGRLIRRPEPRFPLPAPAKDANR
jgi:hypothetical protein